MSKDSFEFADKIQNFNACHSYLVSYDVRSLFTNVPLDDTINHICTKIDFKNFPVNEKTLRTLLSLACKNVLFQFDGKLFVQNDGVAMGSKLAPTLANFAMDMIEGKFVKRPLFYQRYVDDVFESLITKAKQIIFLIISIRCIKISNLPWNLRKIKN